jgi:LPS-assembly protein
MLAALVAGGMLSLAPMQETQAQTLSDMASRRAGNNNDNKHLTVEAREMVYDNDRNTVAASGDVIL